MTLVLVRCCWFMLVDVGVVHSPLSSFVFVLCVVCVCLLLALFVYVSCLSCCRLLLFAIVVFGLLPFCVAYYLSLVHGVVCCCLKYVARGLFVVWCRCCCLLLFVVCWC